MINKVVMARNNKRRMPDVPGRVKKRLGPLTYLIETDTGQIWKRHVDHLKSLGHPSVPQSTEEEQLPHQSELDSSTSPVATSISESDANTEQLSLPR